jgi:putative sigma-54 modulation protein
VCRQLTHQVINAKIKVTISANKGQYMNIAIKATNLDLTEALRAYAEDKVGNLDKYADSIDAKIELERDRKHASGSVFRAEVTLHVKGKMIRADARAEDMYAAIDLVIPKLKEQVSKSKKKKDTLQKRGARSAKHKV